MLSRFTESIREILWMIKVCLTTIWFWLPILYVGYSIIQLILIFYVHPLTILILPVLLTIFSVLKEEERIKRKYGIKTEK